MKKDTKQHTNDPARFAKWKKWGRSGERGGLFVVFVPFLLCSFSICEGTVCLSRQEQRTLINFTLLPINWGIDAF